MMSICGKIFRNVGLLCVAMLPAMMPAIAHAGPISYTISFTGGAVSPNGSFVYDSSAAPGFRFSVFSVNWDGLPTFDVTSAANSPFFQLGDGNCAGDAFQLLERTACSSHASGFPQWVGMIIPGSSFFTFVDEDTAANPGEIGINVSASNGITDRSRFFVEMGSFSVSPTATVDTSIAPEPGTLLLVLTGAGLLARRIRGGRTSPKEVVE